MTLGLQISGTAAMVQEVDSDGKDGGSWKEYKDYRRRSFLECDSLNDHIIQGRCHCHWEKSVLWSKEAENGDVGRLEAEECREECV